MAARAVLLAFVLLALAPPSALALEVRTQEEVTIPSGTTVLDDLAISSVLVKIDGRVAGDVYVVAQYVFVDGEVDGDLIGAAQEINVRGVVHGNVRALAPTLVIGGVVDRRVLAGASNLALDGRVGGSVVAAAERLRLGSRVAGPIDYWSARPADVDPAARPSRLTRHQPVQIEVGEQLRRALVIGGKVLTLAWLIGTVILAGILQRIAPSMAEMAGSELARRPIEATLLGLLVLVGLPAASALLAITLIGLPLAAILLTLWTIGLLTGPAVASGGLAWLVARRLGWTTAPTLLGLTGAFALALMALLPWIGGVLYAVATCLGLGVLLILARTIDEWPIRWSSSTSSAASSTTSPTTSPSESSS